VHYDDLSADLPGEMRRLADQLGITVPEPLWPDLVRAATFEQMRKAAQAQTPDPAGILKDPAAFFRRGYSGAGHEELGRAELARYYARAARLAPPDMLGWLHRDSGAGQDRGDPPGHGGAAPPGHGGAAPPGHGGDQPPGHGGMESAVTG